mmetsp:Transcript_13525/g.16563  ORF Transcript_13525/g.16563 Transcript_13525/m.16563 type:complete len:90 (+) Transcript_13525:236-505(+)
MPTTRRSPVAERVRRVAVSTRPHHPPYRAQQFRNQREDQVAVETDEPVVIDPEDPSNLSTLPKDHHNLTEPGMPQVTALSAFERTTRPE